MPDYAHVNKVSKNKKKRTINVIQHVDSLSYLRLFYNRAFSIASKIDLDDQNLLLATVQLGTRNFGHHFSVTSKNCNVNHSLLLT
jgi:hypothetical protein